MSNKVLNARFQHKIDTYENWSKATNFIPLKGELIIYTTDENGNEKIGFKVGTGEPDKNVHQLDFISLGEANDIGGGLTEVSWEDIKNKPFYEMGFNYEWDGNTEGLESFNLAGTFNFYKISSDIPTKEELTGAIISSYFDGDLLEGTIGVGEIADFIDTNNGNFAILFGGQLPIAFVASTAGEDSAMGMDFEILSTGLWFMSANEGEYTHYVKTAESIVKTLDEQYIPDIFVKSENLGKPNGIATLDKNGKVPLSQLPDNIGSGESGGTSAGGVTSWNDLTDKPFYDEFVLIETPADISNSTTISSQPLAVLGNMSFTFVKIGEAFDAPENTYNALIKMSNDGQNLEFVVSENNIVDLGNGFGILVIEGGAYPLAMNITTSGTATFPMADYYGEDMVFQVAETGFYVLYIDGMATVNSYENGTIKKIDKKFLPDDIGGGVTSWNDLEDKPFYEEMGLNYEWDGNKKDLESFDLFGTFTFCKISSDIPTKEKLTGANALAYFDGSSLEGTIGAGQTIDFIDTDNGNFAASYKGELPIIFVVSTAGKDSVSMAGIEFEASSTGIWFMSANEGEYTKYVKTENGEIKQIDPKYIPNYFGETGIKITWDGKPTDTSMSFGYHVEWDGSALDYPNVKFDPPEEAEGLPEGTQIILQKVDEKRPTLENHYFEYEEIYSGRSENMYLTSDNITSEYDDNGNLIATHEKDMMWVWNVEQPGTVNVMGVPATFYESGLYFIYVEGLFKGTALYDDLYNEMAGLAWYRVADPLNTTLDGYKMKFSIEGQEIEFIFAEGDSDFTAPPIILPSGSSFGGMYVLNIVNDNEYIELPEDWGGLSFTVEKAGLYLLDFLAMESDQEITFDYLVSPDYELVKIDQKYLPNISSSSQQQYQGYAIEADESNSDVDLVLLDYHKGLLGATSLEDMYKSMVYPIPDNDFIITFSSLSSSGKILSSKFENIRIGIATDFPPDVNNLDSVICGVIVELYNQSQLDLKHQYTFRCIKSPSSNIYLGIPIDGIAFNVNKNFDIPVSSGAVYNYINNLGLNPDDLADTKTKANTQANWAENDSSSIAYIQNRLVYDKPYAPNIICNTKPSGTSYPLPVAEVDVFGTACHYRQLTDISSDAVQNALTLAENITSLCYYGTIYQKKNLKVFGNEDVAIVKHSNYEVPLLFIKVGSYYSGGEFDGFTIPSCDSGVWGLCSKDDSEFSTNYVSSVYFDTFPQQLPVKYIPTDEEITQNSTNLISSGAVYNALTSIEDNLQFDTKPTLNSEKLVKSGAIAAALNEKADKTNVNASMDALNVEIGKKANQSDVTATVNSLNTEIGKKANQADVTSTINNLNTNLTTEISKKANAENVYSKTEIDGFLTGAFHYKGSVDNFAQLPTTADVGDVYNVKNADVENNINAGDNVVWCEVSGVGHWDALSGIVDLSAYWTGEEVQDKLDELEEEIDSKANQVDLDIVATALETKANQTDLVVLSTEINKKVDQSDLAKVALTNNYLDLENIPCYWQGVDQFITWNGQIDNRHNISFYSFKNVARYFVKVADWADSASVADYKNSFSECASNLYPIPSEKKWTQVGETYLLQDDHDWLIALIPQNNMTLYLSPNSPNVKFAESGIYFCKHYSDNVSYVSKAIFKKQYFTLDSAYLPIATSTVLGGVKIGDNLSISEDGTISATSLDWDNVQNKPETFTPNTHNHDDLYYTETEIDSKLTAKQDKSNLVTAITQFSTDAQYPSAKLLYNTKTTLENSINTKVDKAPGSRLMTNTEGEKLAGIAEGANKYTLPAASTTTLGGVKVGDNLSVSADGTISATSLDWEKINGKPTTFTPSEHNHDNIYYTESEIDTKVSALQTESNANLQTVKSELESSINTTKSDLEVSINTAKLDLETSISLKQNIDNLVTSIDENSTDEQYPSAKLLYDIVGDCSDLLDEISMLIGE